MNTITVNASKMYEIKIGSGILDDAGGILHKLGSTAAIITDDIVGPLYAERLEHSLSHSRTRVVKYVIPHGEASKNAEQFLSIINFLANEKLTRTDTVIALGGGVVGDLAGFSAAVYMRGIGFVQIPTTLLAAVDSSVGGKTAINLSAGKNLAGVFYQPDMVLCDVALLSTLKPEVFRDGCAEVIKYGVIASADFFKSLEAPMDTHLKEVIARCVEIKRDIVMEDELEKGVRKLLNFGHTIGHAIELLSDYKISHGNAVAAGMAIITRAAARMKICDSSCKQSLLQMLKHYNLPVNTTFDSASIAHACLADKKRDGGKVTMVFPERIGKCILEEIKVEGLENVIKLGLEEN
ncbi:MAG: 3-dehydroquinate synthase [Treponema sp.]|jgi:3-dehydroquinate synthase|nr:3-dehydroquinate synthase [Treponema sp.]